MLTDKAPHLRHDYRRVGFYFSEATAMQFDVVKAYLEGIEGYELKNPEVVRKLIRDFYHAILKQQHKKQPKK